MWDQDYTTKFMKETGPKVGCFAGFCHHRSTTMSAHTHVYCYSLFESGYPNFL